MSYVRRWTLRDCIDRRCTSEEYVADLKLDVDERLKREHQERVDRVVTMAGVKQLEACGVCDVAEIARRYAVDRPRWWHRLTRRNGGGGMLSAQLNDAAKVLGVHPNTVLSWLDRGILKSLDLEDAEALRRLIYGDDAE